MTGGPESGGDQLPILTVDSCSDCGLCCQGIGSPAMLLRSMPRLRGPHPYRRAGFPQELADELDRHFLGLQRGQEPQEQCLWYDDQTKSCRHYEWRPQICHDYELGGQECLTLRAKHRIHHSPTDSNE